MIDVRRLGETDLALALFRLEGAYNEFEERGLFSIPDYDIPCQAAPFRNMSREAVKLFYEQRDMEDASVHMKLTSLMYHMGAGIEDLVFPSGISPEDASRDLQIMEAERRGELRPSSYGLW
jgi:hypothetical protein